MVRQDMSFEKDIKQTPHKISDYQKGIANLVHTYNVVVTHLEKYIGSHDLTLPQFNVLRILRGQYPNPSTNNLIRDRIIHRSSDVTRIVDRLISKGLVERTGCPNDRRKVDILISQEGLRILAAIDAQMPEMERMLGGLDTQEIVLFNDMLDKIRAQVPVS